MSRASAPGKLMLAGEYVVVERGVPALAVAVDRRIEVVAEAWPARQGWVVSSEGLGLTEAPVEQVPVLAEAVRRTPGLGSGGRLVVTSALGQGADKPGLGGSAALSVAAVAALRRLAGGVEGEVLERALAVHRAAQGGRGSGYDVATAYQGGITVFEPPLLAGAPEVRAVTWPEGLYAAVFWTKHGSATVELLERMEAWRNEDPESLDACLDPLAEETLALVGAFRAGAVGPILDAVAQVQEELQLMDRIGELGILSHGHGQLLGVIEDNGGIARTSGAGGGDCAWALSDDPERLDAIAEAAAGRGFERLDVVLGGAGLVEPEEA